MRFEEEQRFRQKWIWILLLVTTLPVLVLLGRGLYRQLVLGQPFGNAPASDAMLLFITIFTFLLLAGVLALFLWARLLVRVADGEILIRFRPFHIRGRRIALRDVAQADARRYNPLLEYGGWGIRYGMRGMAYNVSGNDGVQLVLADDTRILIGSQRSEELAHAIRSAITPSPR